MRKINLENLNIIRKELQKLNSGEEINFENLSYISHEFYLYLKTWFNDQNTDWNTFKKENHLLKNKQLSGKENINLNILTEIRNISFYKKLTPEKTFNLLKQIHGLKAELVQINRNVEFLEKAS